MKRSKVCTTIIGLALSLGLIAAGCSGKGTGGSGSAGAGTTQISGKVTLSGSILSGKPSFHKGMYSVPAAKPSTKAYREFAAKMPVTGLNKILNAVGDIQPLSNATVDLYDADHPEWLYPIATGSTDSSGNYSLSTMTNASKNEGASYQDGDPIPVGKYTLVAYKGGIGQKPVVAVQTIVTKFEGDVPDVNFEVIDSDVAPTVIAILGLPKNKDGSQTWGGTGTTHPANSAIQVTFSMPIVREYLSSIAVSSADGGTVPTGKWTLSADWLTATYYFDAGQEMTAGRTYTITVYGSDDTGNHAKVVNVYGNPVEQTSTCTFVASAADSLSPTVQWNSPTVIEMGNLVDVTQSFRIESNEILDVNKLSLQGSPSIGVKPGVIFLGRNAAGLYVYEFDLGEPLQLDTPYSLTVTGGKDLAGHSMNVLSGSIRTNKAEDTPGIDPAATPETQNLQAAVKSAFGKWVRSLNDRNLAQFQGLMSAEFYMEYDVSYGIDSGSDINRDGRFSFAEFSNMIVKNAFLQWDYCGTRITGTVAPTAGTSINVFPLDLPPRADFEFKLSASNTLNSQQCSEAAPKEMMYATLRYKNGVWKIVRASSGIDTRDKTIASPELLTTRLYQISNASIGFPFSTSSPALSDGAKLDGIPNSPVTVNTEDIAAKFEWDAIPGVTTYVLMVMDARDPWQGRAVAFPSTVTSARTDQRWVADLGGTDVSTKFGLQGMGSMSYVAGGRYYWEVIGFSTIASADMPSKSITILLQDITAASFTRSFGIAGVYDELLIQVRPGTNSSATPIPYSEVLYGYDLKNNGWATLTVYTPNKVPTGNIYIYGSQSASDTLSFGASGVATKTIVLYQGWNWVSVCDSGDSTATPPKPQLCKSFSILTTGGIQPVIGIWEVIDGTGATLTGDASQYYVASTSAAKVTINGIVTDPTVGTLSLNLWNENGAYSYSQTPVTCDINNNCTFGITLDVYKGDNWISIYGSGATKSYNSYIGIYAETGALWVPPIGNIAVYNDADLTQQATKRAEYPSSSDWKSDPGSDSTVTITGKFKAPQNGTYYVSSEGGYANGTLTALSDGSFSINVLLYNGWNYVSLYDSSGARYGVNIYTTTGKTVIKPTVTTIDGAAYGGTGSATVAGCTATIGGTALLGAVTVNVNGYGLASGGVYTSFWENQSLQAAGTSDPGSFTVSVPVASGAGSYTYVDIFDKDWKVTSVRLTTTGNCTYTPPSSTFEGVRNAAGAVITSDNTYTGPYDYGYYNSGTSNTVTLFGTSKRPGYSLYAEMETCGNRVRQTASSSTTPNMYGTYDWSVTMNVYGTYNSGYNYINLYDGSWKLIYVISGNSNPVPPPPLQVSVTPINSVTYSQCNNLQVDSGSATTVTLSGTTTAPDGTGYYNDPLNGNHPFTITGGAFTITGITVYNGWNNIYLYDTSNNYFYVGVQTTNGNTKPQFVKITSPLNNASVSGTVSVSGTITDPVASGYAPSSAFAHVYNSVTGVTTQYSSDLYEQQQYGYGAMTFDGTNFSFSYDMGSNTGGYTNIWVYAYDSVNGINHGHQIYVNTGGGWSDYYEKPGPSQGVADDRKKTQQIEQMKWELMTTSKTR